jgi:uncharacterized protein
MMHIEDAVLAEVQNILLSHVPELEVWAFGSRVHGRNLKPFSDLDLVLVTSEPFDAIRMLDLKEAFIESDLPFKVDVLDWAKIDDKFQQIIEKEYVVVKKGRDRLHPQGQILDHFPRH